MTRKRSSKQLDNDLWEAKFIEKMKIVHKRNIAVKAKRLLKRINGVKSNMVARSAKYEVACTITVDELRQLALDAYGSFCRYSQRQLTIDSMVFDHLIPISKGGPSTRENIQIISKFSNAMKGSLSEEYFFILLNWLDTVPDELRQDVSIRLAHGIR